MGLLDKIKDLFTDEEEVIEEDKDKKVKIKEIKKEEIKKKFEENLGEETSEHKLPTFMRNKLLEEEEIKLPEEEKEENVGSRVNSNIINNLYTDDTVEIPSLEGTSSFKFPVDFDDNDFSADKEKFDYSEEEKEIPESEEDATPSIIRQEKEKKRVADLYKDKVIPEDEPKFRASPIISPIYGVLDKNYSKDEIKEIDEDSYEIKRNSVTKNVDFESVRKKAYGSLADDIKDNLNCETCEYRKEAQEKKASDNLVYDILKEDEEEKKEDTIDDVSFGDATENYYDYGVEYEPPKRKRTVKAKEPKEEKEEIKIVNSETIEEESIKEKNKEVPPVKSDINLLSTLKKSVGEKENSTEKNDLELTDDLFNMIDSMYDERNDD